MSHSCAYNIIITNMYTFRVHHVPNVTKSCIIWFSMSVSCPTYRTKFKIRIISCPIHVPIWCYVYFSCPSCPVINIIMYTLIVCFRFMSLSLHQIVILCNVVVSYFIIPSFIISIFLCFIPVCYTSLVSYNKLNFLYFHVPFMSQILP